MLYALITYTNADGKVANTGWFLTASVDSALRLQPAHVLRNLLTIETTPLACVAA